MQITLDPGEYVGTDGVVKTTLEFFPVAKKRFEERDESSNRYDA